ncbi:MAG: hypothetical protein ACTSQ8_25765 [Candidatus Helarchaeota archaeon]
MKFVELDRRFRKLNPPENPEEAAFQCHNLISRITFCPLAHSFALCFPSDDTCHRKVNPPDFYKVTILWAHEIPISTSTN